MLATGPCLARLLVLSPELDAAREVARRLRRHGYATHANDFTIVPRQLAQDDRPDVVVIEADASAERACALAQSLKSNSDSSHVPVIMTADSSPAPLRHMVSAGVDDFILRPANDQVLLARLPPLVRLATMHGELRCREATARGLGLEVPVQPAAKVAAQDRCILAVTGSAEVTDGLEEALGPDCRVAVARDVFEAGARLHHDSFDAVIVMVAKGSDDDALHFCVQVRNNPRHFNLPVLLIAGPNLFEDPARPYRSGASTVIADPFDAAELHASVEVLVRRQRLRLRIRDALKGIQDAAGAHEIGGVFGREFLRAHLDRRIADAGGRRHLSLVSFHLQNLGGVMRDHGQAAADDLLRQVAEWITTLVRVEDLAGRYGEKEICVVLPDTAREEAAVVAQRISGVLLNTQFAVSGVKQPMLVWLEAGAAESKPGDTPEALIERARQALG